VWTTRALCSSSHRLRRLRFPLHLPLQQQDSRYSRSALFFGFFSTLLEVPRPISSSDLQALLLLGRNVITQAHAPVLRLSTSKAARWLFWVATLKESENSAVQCENHKDTKTFCTDLNLLNAWDITKTLTLPDRQAACPSHCDYTQVFNSWPDDVEVESILVAA
jgi:hypothetical protein